MTAISGWAYTRTQDEEAKRRSDRYSEIKHLRPQMALKPNPSYARTYYTGTIPEGVTLSDLDLLILCDSGNTCFGGSVDRYGKEFKACVYTD